MFAVLNGSHALNSFSACPLRCSRGCRLGFGGLGLLRCAKARDPFRRARLLRWITLRSSRLPHVSGLAERVGNILARLRDVPDDTANASFELLRGIFERPEPWDRIRVIEVPGVLRKPDEIPDGRIGSPGPTKRRMLQLQRN